MCVDKRNEEQAQQQDMVTLHLTRDEGHRILASLHASLVTTRGDRQRSLERLLRSIENQMN